MLKLIRSTRVALFAIIGLLLITALKSVFLGLDDMPLIDFVGYFLLFLIVLGLSSSLYQRLKARYRMRKRSISLFRHSKIHFNIKTKLSVPQAHKIISQHALDSNWGKENQLGNHKYVFQKGNIGFWGSILFHLGLLLLIAGLFINAGFGERAGFSITEGQVFNSELSGFQIHEKGVLHFSDENFSIKAELTQVSPPIIEDRLIVQPLQAKLKISEPVDTTLKIQLGNASYINSYRIHASSWGYSPGIIIKNKDGHEILSSYVRLASISTDQMRKGKDHIMLSPVEDLKLEYDPKSTELDINGVKRELRNLSLKLMSHHQLVDSLSLHQGMVGYLGDYSIKFIDLRHWAEFDAAMVPNLLIIYICMAMGIVGLFLRSFWSLSRVNVSIHDHYRDRSLTISYKTEKWSFQKQKDFESEIEALMIQLKVSSEDSAHNYYDAQASKTERNERSYANA